MSKEYREWVSSLPCCVSGIIGSTQAHHAIGHSHVTGKSMGKKGSDLTCLPLSAELHNELHQNGYNTFERKHNMSQLEQAFKTILLAEKLGIITIDSAMAKRQ